MSYPSSNSFGSTLKFVSQIQPLFTTSASTFLFVVTVCHLQWPLLWKPCSHSLPLESEFPTQPQNHKSAQLTSARNSLTASHLTKTTIQSPYDDLEDRHDLAPDIPTIFSPIILPVHRAHATGLLLALKHFNHSSTSGPWQCCSHHKDTHPLMSVYLGSFLSLFRSCSNVISSRRPFLGILLNKHFLPSS